MEEISKLIERIEDYYEVWSDGCSGDSLEVAEKLAAYCVGSIQTAKDIIRRPTLLVEAMSKECALAELRELSKTGLNCMLVHVGRLRLDEIDPQLIRDTLTLSGSIPLSAVFTDVQAKLILHVTDGMVYQIPLDTESENGFMLYLACLRDLLRRKMIFSNPGR